MGIDSREDNGLSQTIDALINLKGLEALSLNHNLMQVPEVNSLITTVSQQQNLVQIQLSRCGIDNEELEILANGIPSMQVKNLNLSRNEFSAQSFPYLITILEKFAELNKLILHHNLLGNGDG